MINDSSSSSFYVSSISWLHHWSLPFPCLQQWSNLTFYPSPYPYCFICYTHIILYTDDIFIFKPISYPSDILFQLELDTISFGLFGLLTFFKSIPQNVSTLSFLTNLFPILTHFFSVSLIISYILSIFLFLLLWHPLLISSQYFSACSISIHTLNAVSSMYISSHIQFLTWSNMLGSMCCNLYILTALVL